jgi:hypothetical protein
MRFPGAAVARQQNVLAAGEELASRQLQYESFVQRSYGQEIEAVHTNSYRRSTLPDRTVSECPISCMQEHFVSGIKRFPL